MYDAKLDYPDSYFENRLNNDDKRLEQFRLDARFIRKHVSKGIVCDVGCSTGEFLRHINWEGELFGMEISEYAKQLARDIISFEKNICTETDFFDLVIMRGTIQHLDQPFRMIQDAHKSLKVGGHIVFLATPNANSVLYRVKGTLPFLDASRNFYIPGDRELVNVLNNFGFELIEMQYPYIETPYCNLVKDHWMFVKNVFSKKFYPHAFYKSCMNIIVKKR